MSAFAEDKESEKKESTKAVPLEKKLDKRGLLNLGYGYGINGLDIGYIGSGYHGGAYHHAAPAIESAPFAHHYGNPIYLGEKTNVHKTHTIYKGIPYPYEVWQSIQRQISKLLNLSLHRSPSMSLMKSRNTFPTQSRLASHNLTKSLST